MSPPGLQFHISMGQLPPESNLDADPSENDDSIEDEFPNPSHSFSNKMKLYKKSMGKQDFYSFKKSKGQPEHSEMRMTSDPKWAHPVLDQKELLEASEKYKQANFEMQKDMFRHQQMVKDILHNIEVKADVIPLQKEKFFEDVKSKEKQAEEEKY